MMRMTMKKRKPQNEVIIKVYGNQQIFVIGSHLVRRKEKQGVRLSSNSLILKALQDGLEPTTP